MLPLNSLRDTAVAFRSLMTAFDKVYRAATIIVVCPKSLYIRNM